MPHLLILEGPDAVGKTTFAEQFRHTYPNTDYIHLTHIPETRSMWRLQYMSLWRAQFQLSRGKNVIIDRHWMSDNVYAGVYRGGSKMPFDVCGYDRVIRRLCGVYVMFCPPVQFAVDNHAKMAAKGREMYEVDDRIRQVAKSYWDLWYGYDFEAVSGAVLPNRDYCTVLKLNGGMSARSDAFLLDITQGIDPRLNIGQICDLSSSLQATQYSAAFDHAQCNYLGHIEKACYLIVGDRINPSKSGRWPFVDLGASSRVVSQALHAYPNIEDHFIWTNARDQDDHIANLMEMKPNLQVIALGKEAGKKLTSMNINHEEIYHPSYALRFGKIPEFTTQLELAIQSSK